MHTINTNKRLKVQSSEDPEKNGSNYHVRCQNELLPMAQHEEEDQVTVGAVQLLIFN